VEFSGQENEKGLILLKAKHPPGWWARAAARLEWFIGWVVYSGIVFGLGVLFGWLMAA